MKIPAIKIMAAAFIAAFPAIMQAVTIVENFDGSYPGSAGDGWTTAWVTTTGSGVTVNSQISNSTPLSTGGGSYLSASLSATTANSATVNRSFNNSTGLDTSSPYQITFSFRLDKSLVSGQQIFLYAAPGASSVTSSAVSWSIVGDSGSGWLINNGNQNGGVTAQVSTGLALTAGVTYYFTIDVDPVGKTWDVGITSASGNYANAGADFGFRTAATSMTTPTLSFGGKPGSAEDSLEFSIDSIAVMQVPEPKASAMMLPVLGWLLLGHRGFRRLLF